MPKKKGEITKSFKKKKKKHRSNCRNNRRVIDIQSFQEFPLKMKEVMRVHVHLCDRLTEMGEDIIITHYNKIKDEQNIILYRT